MIICMPTHFVGNVIHENVLLHEFVCLEQFDIYCCFQYIELFLDFEFVEEEAENISIY